jgi:peptide/nickel transport system substrate-binding protein
MADFGDLGLANVGVAPFSGVSWAHPDPSTLNDYAFDMVRAAQLMDEAGWIMQSDGYRWKDGQRFELNWLIYHEANWPGIVTGMAADTWGQLGVHITIEMMDFTTVQARTTQAPLDQRDFDIYQMGFSLAIDPDLTNGLWDFDAHREGGFNGSGWYNTRFQELIHLGRSAFGVENRQPIYHELAQMANYYMPVWPLSTGTELHATTSDVHNFEIGAFMTWTLAILQQGTWVE